MYSLSAIYHRAPQVSSDDDEKETGALESTAPTSSLSCFPLRWVELDERDPLLGRGDWIRTSDLMLPKHAHYQAVLHPVTRFSYCGLAGLGS